MDKEKLQIVKDFRRLLHENPEAPEQEFKTRELIKEFLEKHTSVEIVDKGRWLYAIKREDNAKETLAFRADHDAIISEDGEAFHGCGHDGHTAILAGLALHLEGVTTGNNIVYLFQHAEETGVGGPECVALFDEVEVDRIYGVHNMPGFEEGVLHFKPGTQMCASEGMTVELIGKQSHASEPENGINPVYVIAELIKKLEPLVEFHGFDTPIEFEDLNFSSMTLCTIVNVKVGEKAFGVSPSTGEISMTLRAEKSEDLESLKDYIKGFIKTRAEEVGMKYNFSYSDGFLDTSSTPEVVEHMKSIFDKEGFEYVVLEEPFRGSEDFGSYTKIVPGAYIIIGSGVDYASIHSVEFDFPDQIIERGIEAYSALAKSNM